MNKQMLTVAINCSLLVLTLTAGQAISVAASPTAGASATSSGAVLRYGIDLEESGGSPFSLDPAQANGSPLEGAFDGLIYDYLLRPGNDGPLPGLATSYSVPDPLTIELVLRAGVRFQDGTPFGPSAVAFNIDRDIHSGDPIYSNGPAAAIVGVDQAGPHLVRIHLNQADAANVLIALTTSLGWIASPRAVQTEGSGFAQRPIGAGPYRETAFVPDQVISVRRNQDFWEGHSCAPLSLQTNCWQLAGVDFVQTATGAPEVSALLSGAVDYIAVGDPATYAGVAHKTGVTVLKQPSNTNVYYLRICNGHRPFSNPNVAHAIRYALDLPAITQVATGGTGVPTSELWPPGSVFYSASLAASYDPAKARRLIMSARATGTTFQIAFPNFSQFTALAQLVQAELGAVGLHPELSPSNNIVHDLLMTRSYPAGILTVISAGNAARIQPLTANTESNWCNYSNSAINAAYATFSAGTASTHQIASMWADVNKLVVASDSLFPLFTTGTVGAYNNNRVGGVVQLVAASGIGTPNFQTMYMKP